MKSGLIIGKFLPPHLGHQYLIDFARNYVDRLTVLVCSIKSEPIPGELRFQWMREMFPDVNVIHVTDENPQEPHEHPDFWQIWHDTIFRALPEGADYLFASEDYGWKLSKVLGMQYITVDPGRELVPVSGTMIRTNPMRHWDYIPPVVRPHFIKRVCIVGPESTGKSTLAKDLAKHFDTVFVGEYARPLLKPKKGTFNYADISRIAKGQIASEEALSRQANRLLICDTDLITTTCWSRMEFNKCPRWILKKAEERQYHLYLLLNIDVPWIQDGERYHPELRKWFFQKIKNDLEAKNRQYVLISGSWQERFKKAVEEVNKLLVA